MKWRVWRVSKRFASHLKIQTSAKINTSKTTSGNHDNRVRQLYKNISMLFLFPVKYGINARFLSCYGYSSALLLFDTRKLPHKTTCINSTFITQPTLSFYLQETCRICNFHANCYHYNHTARHRKFTKYRVKLDLG